MGTIREMIENNEKQFLCDRAELSCNTKGRNKFEMPCSIRTEYQRDRDRIIHCASFRRLKHKTQVFIAPEGDHYRTRLTHTLEVTQIARTISRALFLNEDLTEAIALGHDLGHTPFGHAGERALNEVLPGGFKHYEQSVRVAELLEKDGAGLNLTYEVKDGIVNHTNGNAQTLEGRVVRYADRIAYMNHDIDDAIKAGIFSESDLPLRIREGLGNSKSVRINTLVMALISNGVDDIALPDPYNTLYDELHAFLFDTIYINPIAKGEESKAQKLVITLFEYFSAYPEKLPAEYRHICETQGAKRASADFIAGMSDRYAVTMYNDLFVPKSWRVL